MFADLELFFDSYKHLLTALAILVALGGLWLTLVQLRLNHRFQREMVAKAAYREYLKLCIAKPMLASGKVTKTSLNWDEYTWFVSMLFWACDEMILHSSDKVAIAALKLDLANHRTYLASPEFQAESALYTRQLRNLIDEVLASGASDKGKAADAPKLAEAPKPAESPKTEPAKA
jgi:hypothetical protein